MNEFNKIRMKVTITHRSAKTTSRRKVIIKCTFALSTNKNGSQLRKQSALRTQSVQNIDYPKPPSESIPHAYTEVDKLLFGQGKTNTVCAEIIYGVPLPQEGVT